MAILRRCRFGKFRFLWSCKRCKCAASSVCGVLIPAATGEEREELGKEPNNSRCNFRAASGSSSSNCKSRCSLFARKNASALAIAFSGSKPMESAASRIAISISSVVTVPGAGDPCDGDGVLPPIDALDEPIAERRLDSLRLLVEDLREGSSKMGRCGTEADCNAALSKEIGVVPGLGVREMELERRRELERNKSDLDTAIDRGAVGVIGSAVNGILDGVVFAVPGSEEEEEEKAEAAEFSSAPRSIPARLGNVAIELPSALLAATPDSMSSALRR